jgi:serine/threonine protein phosphatase PrpC
MRTEYRYCQCNMFAVYDGHGGADCCNYLKENLHSYSLNNLNEKDVV